MTGVIRTVTGDINSKDLGWTLIHEHLVCSLAKYWIPETAPELATITRTVVTERARVAGELASFSGVEVTPSQANFLWIRCERPAGEVFEALKQRSVLVRSFHERGGRLGQQLRVTIGTPAENDAFLTSLREVL